MLNIAEKNDEELITLYHGKNVFHDALAKVSEGESRFHVTDESGQVLDYDLVFTTNMMLFPEQVRTVIKKLLQGGTAFSTFLNYDENDEENMCLDFLKQFKKIEIECTDEYSVAVARVALKLTDIPVYYLDEKLSWFVDEHERLHKVDAFAEKDKTVLRLNSNIFDMGYSKRDWTTICSLAAFQNIFFYHYYCALDGCDYKVPEGVYTEKDGAVQGQETDAYILSI